MVFGGVSINPQIDALRHGCDILVATPGRLLDHRATARRRPVAASRFLVLDEADRMLDMGFIRDIRRVLEAAAAAAPEPDVLGDYSDDIRQLARRSAARPGDVEVAPRNATADSVEQRVYRVPKDHKRHLLAHLHRRRRLATRCWCSRAPSTARIAWRSSSSATASSAAAIHGNKSQSARTRALADFKDYKVTALVATEVAARGLDIKELPQVVNYELPNVPEDYVHRIGRTARAGSTGRAVSLVSPDERELPARHREAVETQSADCSVARLRGSTGDGSAGPRSASHAFTRRTSSSTPPRHHGDSRRLGQTKNRH